MGTPAKAHVRITCNNSAGSKIEKWIDKANNKKLKGEYAGDYDIQEDGVFGTGKEVSFTLLIESGRVQNLEWQLNNLSEFARNLKGVKEFSADVWYEGEGVYWEK